MIKVELLKNHFLLCEKDFQSLNSKGFAKKTDNIYSLDIYEACYLIEKKKIQIWQRNTEITFRYITKIKGFDFKNYLVYKDLKSKGYIIRSGFKYGFAFRIYDKGIKEGEEHSLWLIEPVKENQKFDFKELAGKNRIAHSTNKKMLFAIVDDDNSITYLENSWKRL